MTVILIFRFLRIRIQKGRPLKICCRLYFRVKWYSMGMTNKCYAYIFFFVFYHYFIRLDYPITREKEKKYHDSDSFNFRYDYIHFFRVRWRTRWPFEGNYFHSHNRPTCRGNWGDVMTLYIIGDWGKWKCRWSNAKLTEKRPFELWTLWME